MIKLKDILKEAKKRDYKAEYKKFQSSTKSKKYRAELNAYNRKKGTYGNGDGKDASHKGGKIVGFEAESKNRGRAEKSRLKKEGKLTEKKKTIPFKDIPSYMKDHYPTQKHWDYYQSLPDGKKWMYYKKYPNILAKQSKKTDDFIAQQKKELGLEGKLKEGKLNEAKETIFDVAARVMKDKQNQNYKSKVGMVKVDMQSANLLVKVFKKVNPKMKKILSDLGEKNPAGLMKTLWAVVK